MEASAWVRRFAGQVRTGGVVLDLACGGGRHTRLFARLGHPVVAVDRDVSRLDLSAGDAEEAARVEIVELDLEHGQAWPVGDRRFAGIVVTHYLHRPLLPALVAALADDGVLIYETFAAGHEKFGSPRRPEFLLQRGELLTLAHGLHVLAFEEGIVDGAKPAVVQRLCAVRDVAPRVLPER